MWSRDRVLTERVGALGDWPVTASGICRTEHSVLRGVGKSVFYRVRSTIVDELSTTQNCSVEESM